ncbi:MAG: hypothetical protein F4150_01480 [Chloroflexi bacterium]|nr:hypothetical protein [Chloroflexota bacterium]
MHALPDLDLLRSELTGLEPGAAAARLVELLSLEEEPRVTLEPEWVPWRWTPRSAGRIAIDFAGTLEQPEEEGEGEPEGDASGDEGRSPAGRGTLAPDVAHASSAAGGGARGR